MNLRWVGRLPKFASRRSLPEQAHQAVVVFESVILESIFVATQTDVWPCLIFGFCAIMKTTTAPRDISH